MESTPDLEQGSLFGMPCLKVHGKAVLGSFDEGVVFKLFGENHERAIGLEGSVLFDPSDKGRAMKDWVVVPLAHKDVWGKLARQAIG